MTTPFQTYAFLASGASATRTLPDRLGDIKNVRDFGAVGDGMADDLAAIMAAYNWTANSNRGTVYFPPGTYYVSAPIDISNIPPAPHSYVRFVGEMGLSTIVGNFDDYVIKRYLLASNAVSGGHTVERLTIINSSALGGGIRMGVCVGAAIRDCEIIANFGIDTDNSDVFGPPDLPGAYAPSLELIIENCNLRAYTALASGSTGMARGANGPTYNCKFKDFDTAIRTYGGQGTMAFFGCYFEHNNFGVANAIGPYPSDPTAPGGAGDNVSGGLNFSGLHFKNNGIAIAYDPGGSRYAGILIEAEEGGISGNPQYGIYTPSGGACAYLGITIQGQFQQAGFHLAGGEATVSPSQIAGISVNNTSTLGGVNWQLPLTANSMDIMGCNVASVWTMAKLPALNCDVVSATWSGGIATITVTGNPIGLATGQLGNVTIAGVTPSGYNGYFQNVSITGNFKFTYAVADPGGSGGAAGTAFITTVSDIHRPNVYEGYCYNVSDANTATWGAAVTAGGGSNHVKLRFTPAAWTVVGK